MSRLSREPSYETRRDSTADPHGVTWSRYLDAPLRRSQGVDPSIADRLSDYLRTAMGVRVQSSASTIVLEISLGSEDRICGEDDNSTLYLNASSARSLLQGIYWLQDEMESAGGPFLAHGPNVRNSSPGILGISTPSLRFMATRCWSPRSIRFPRATFDKLARVRNRRCVDAVGSQQHGSIQDLPRVRAPQTSASQISNKLIERAKRPGVKIFLYVNEPRVHASGVLPQQRELRGAESRGLYAMCTSQAMVREWISDSLAYLFDEVARARRCLHDHHV